MLGAAARVFARSSFEHASMDEIAAEAGVGKPTLYRYFSSKDALFVAVFEHALDDLEARLERVIEEETQTPARLAGLASEIVRTFRQHFVSLRFVGDTAAEADRSNRRIFRDRRKRIGVYLARAVEDGIGRGEMRAVDPAKTAQIMIGMLWSATATSDGGDTETGRDVVDILLHGVLSRDENAAVGRDHAEAANGTKPAGVLHAIQVNGASA
jgi:TetR/AcrR family transcriptional repressor of mexJK operon